MGLPAAAEAGTVQALTKAEEAQLKAKESNALATGFEGEALDHRRVSDHLVRGVDFLFALTLGQGILLFKTFWLSPLHIKYLPVALALTAVYCTTFLSFIDWHIAMERRPYLVSRELPSRDDRLERWRVVIDLGIVMVYAYMLINATVLQTHPTHDLSHFLVGFPLLMIGYSVWSLLRIARYPEMSTDRRTVVIVATIIFTLLFAAYLFCRENATLAQNDVVLAIFILATLGYRTVSRRVGKT